MSIAELERPTDPEALLDQDEQAAPRFHPEAIDSDEAPTSHGDTIASGVVLMLAIMVAQRLIGFVRSIFFCRWLEPTELGKFDMAIGFLMLAAPVAVLGLPGSFGRYYEHYRQRGLLGMFLLRTTLVTVLLGGAAVIWMLAAPQSFSRLIYGQAGAGDLVFWTSLCLATVILHNYLVSLFIAARRYRVVSMLQFLQGLLFAVIGLALLVWWQTSAVSLVASFGAACLLSAACCAPWLRSLRSKGASQVQFPSQRAFWSRLMPFAVWIWVTNLLSGLFEMIDRYMIIHFSGLYETDALALVGNYHSSRLIPLLFVSVAMLLSSMITPHLSHDWETGRRQAVSARLNLTLKLLSLTLLSGSMAILCLSPFLFGVLLSGKFDGGLAVLPWTLAYCTWFSLGCVAQNYLWCAEKAGLSSLALLVGLATNVMLNLVLLPRFGLQGAVWATSAANVIALALIYSFSRRRGMQVDRGTWLLSGAPLLVCLPVWAALAAWAAVILLGLTTTLLFSFDEKQQLAGVIKSFTCGLMQRLRGGSARLIEPKPCGQI